jgi:hypothetical protein
MKNLLLLGIAVALFSQAHAQHFGNHHRGNHHNRNNVVVVKPRSPIQLNVNVGFPVRNRRNPVVVYNPNTYYVPNNYYQNQGCNHSNNVNYANNASMMQQNQFQDLILQLRNSSFESDKFSIAKQAIRSNYMSADQIGGIMMEFSYESSKVDFAKFAYPYCLDQQNYYQVNSAFSYSSSIQELENFLK